MKKFFYVSLALVIAACQQPENTNKTVTITGTIENPVNNHIFIKGSKEISSGIIDSTIVDRNGEFIIGFGIVDKNGKFETSFNIDEPGYYKFFHWNEHAFLFLSPGDSMRLSLNTEEFDETINYSGTGSAANNFLAKKLLFEEKIRISSQRLYSLEVEQFIPKTDSVRDVMEKHLDTFLDSIQNINKKFKRFEKANILYSWVEKRFNYPEYCKHYTKKDSVDLGENYDNYLSQINLNDPSLLELGSYKNVLKTYLKTNADKELEKDSSLKDLYYPITTIKLRLIKELFSDEKVKNFMFYSIMEPQITSSGIYKTEALMSDFEKNCTNQDYIAKIEKEVNKRKKQGEGQPAPEFAYPDMNGDTVSLSDFKGKYVYVDVWATWCSPCRREIPYLEKLQEEFKDKNIVFISVSVDDNKESWEKMVKEKNMKGVQLFAKGWKSTIIKDYKIKGIPQFILIDTDGNIINVNAPRPSGNIKEMLEKLEGIEV
ncbi:MAG: TlpA disulfide reductase family protein [Bacteroidota bacterium]